MNVLPNKNLYLHIGNITHVCIAAIIIVSFLGIIIIGIILGILANYTWNGSLSYIYKQNTEQFSKQKNCKMRFITNFTAAFQTKILQRIKTTIIYLPVQWEDQIFSNGSKNDCVISRDYWRHFVCHSRALIQNVCCYYEIFAHVSIKK